MHGLALDDVVVEEGVSGSVPVAERPAAGPLFARLSKGDVVIAPKLDRLFRSALDALKVVEDLKKRGVALHLLDLGGDISGIAEAVTPERPPRADSPTLSSSRPRVVRQRNALPVMKVSLLS